MGKSDFYFEVFSKNYYEFLHDFSQSKYDSDKLLGRFYTAYEVSDEMSERIISESSHILMKESLRIIDPFCGDGRLVISIIKALMNNGYNGSFQIYLWDIDKNAVINSNKSVSTFIDEQGIKAEVNSSCLDAFVFYSDYIEAFDICVTNPPWGLLKPLKMFNSRCSEEELEKYKASIASYDEYMKREFYISMPTSKYGKWGTNIGRCGVEVALRMIKKDGVCGVVSPASLFNDQVSVPFRKWLFSEYCINSISYYPAELKLYGTADVSSITVVFNKGETKRISINLYDKNLQSTKKNLNEEDIATIARDDYTIALESTSFRKGITIDYKNCITLNEYCRTNNLKFIRELDETKLSEKITDNGNIIFAKGYMIDQYSFTPESKYLDESKVKAPDTVNSYKVVWRDVSRNSQKRRVKATFLNKGCIAGNSLGCISSQDDNIDALLFILAVMNSYVFEYQAREKLVSNHVPAGIIKKLMIPNESPSKKIISYAKDALEGKDIRCELEILVAKMYGLSKPVFLNTVSEFSTDNKETKKLDELWGEVDINDI